MIAVKNTTVAMRKMTLGKALYRPYATQVEIRATAEKHINSM
jgi:hypothetical protein